jgi:hypothetical protein
MPRILLLIPLFALLPCRLFCQDGLVLVHFGNNSIRERAVPLYSGPLDTVPVKVFAGDRALESNIAPYIGGLGNSSVLYRCTGETSWRWAIQEEDSGRIYWIAKDSLNEFVTWAGFWNSADCVSGSEPLRMKPGDSSPEVKLPKGSGHYFTVEYVLGDWLYVNMGAACDHPEDVPADLPSTSGWVRWRKDGKILANVTYPE